MLNQCDESVLGEASFDINQTEILCGSRTVFLRSTMDAR